MQFLLAYHNFACGLLLWFYVAEVVWSLLKNSRALSRCLELLNNWWLLMGYVFMWGHVKDGYRLYSYFINVELLWHSEIRISCLCRKSNKRIEDFRFRNNSCLSSSWLSYSQKEVAFIWSLWSTCRSCL